MCAEYFRVYSVQHVPSKPGIQTPCLRSACPLRSGITKEEAGCGIDNGPKDRNPTADHPRSDSRGPRFGELGWRGGMVRYELRHSSRTLRLIPNSCHSVPSPVCVVVSYYYVRSRHSNRGQGGDCAPSHAPFRAVWGLEFWTMACQLQVTSHHMTSPSPTKCGEKVWRMMQLSSKIELAKRRDGNLAYTCK